jgi:hypothetical protein
MMGCYSELPNWEIAHFCIINIHYFTFLRLSCALLRLSLTLMQNQTQINDNKFKQKPQKQLSNCEGNQLIPWQKKREK